MTRMISRRVFLARGGFVIGVGALTPTVLAACGDGGESTTSTGAQAAAPVDETSTTATAPTTVPVDETSTTATAPTTVPVDETSTTATAPTAVPVEEATTTDVPETTAAAEQTTTTSMMEEALAEFESITLAQVGGWISLDSNRTTGGALGSGQHTFEGLLTKLPDRSLIPGLATEMPRKVGDLTYRVKIRTDRTFTDGTPIRASDIVYGYDRLKPERGLGSPFTHYIMFIESIDIISDHELQINLNQRVPEDVLFQRISAIKAYPEEIVEEMGGAEYSLSPTPSSGSMMLAAPFDPEVNVFQRYENYTGPQPLAAREITYVVIPDMASRIAHVEVGLAQIADGVSPQLYRAVEDSPNLELGIARETSFLEMIMMNTTKPPFDNQLVRQALMYSINAQELIDVGLHGEGRVARSPLPPEDPRYIEPQQQYNFDPERSKELLREAGYDPDNAPVHFQLGVVEWAYVYPQAPLFAQRMLEGGFDPALLVDSIDARWVSDIMSAEYDAWVATVGFEVFSYDPDCLFRGWWSGWAENAHFATPGVPSKLDLLLDAALEEPDFDKQNELYARANEMLVTEAGSVPILFQPLAHTWHKSVAGYQMPQTLGMTLFGVHSSER